MIFIAHRGNINGKSLLENEPNYILKSLKNGYDCEIDVRFLNNKWYLGHDKPTYEIFFDFLLNDKFWIHAKTVETLHELMKYNVHCFYHENDPCVLTSKGYIWTYPGYPLKEISICVLPELNNIIEFNCAGICSDNIKKYK